MCYAWKSSDRCLGLFAESYKTSEYSAWLGISPIGHSWGFICSAFSTIFSIIFCLTWLDSPIAGHSWESICPAFLTMFSIIFSTIFCLTWHFPYCPFLEIHMPGLSTHLLFSVVSNLSGYHKTSEKKKFIFTFGSAGCFLTFSRENDDIPGFGEFYERRALIVRK